jgi:hypothetical protein
MPQGRSKWIAVLAFGLAVGVLMGSSSAGALSVPGVTAPSTTLPGATTPAVTTPSVSTPAVPLPGTTPTSSTPAPAPTVTAPSVKTPSVKLPSAKVPSTQTPSVSVGGSGSLSSGSGSGSSSPSSPATRLVQTLAGTQPSSGSNPAGNLSPSGTLPGGPWGLGGAGGPGPAGGSPITGGGLSGPGGTAGPAGGGYWAAGPAGGPGFAGSGSGFGADFAAGSRSRSLATTEGIRSALAPLIGCFYGLSQPELTVIDLRAGFNGQLPHTRQQAARRLGTSPRQIRLTEQRALQRLNGLARTRGCGGTTEFVGGVTVVGGFIGPAELAINRSLVAFGNPAYQGFEQSSFGRLGQVPAFGSPGPLPASFGSGTSGGSTWAIQLLTIMLLVALVGFRRMAPLVIARLRRRPSAPSHENVEGLEPADGRELRPVPAVDRPAERRREKIAA